MQKRNKNLVVILPVVITISIYLVFSSRIESKPNHAGFWIILALGMALGVALTRLIFKQK
jgi:hypothetical protein